MDDARHGPRVPEAFDRFVEMVPTGERDGDRQRRVQPVARLAGDASMCERAALEWCRWEDTHVATAPGYEHDTRYDDRALSHVLRPDRDARRSYACFLEEGQLLRDAGRLAGIPGVMINGRLDISGPPDTAWQLAKRWPDAELVLTDDAGHGAGYHLTFEAVIAATNRFAG